MGNNEHGKPGQNTVVAIQDASNITWYAVATGGGGAYNNAGYPFLSAYNVGGSFYVVNQYPRVAGFTVYPYFIGAPGEYGQPNQATYTQLSATSFVQEGTGGRGGDAGNSIKTGGAGSRSLANGGNSSQYQGHSGVFGGGGGGGIPGVANGMSGGKGKVVIWY